MNDSATLDRMLLDYVNIMILILLIEYCFFTYWYYNIRICIAIDLSCELLNRDAIPSEMLLVVRRCCSIARPICRREPNVIRSLISFE